MTAYPTLFYARKRLVIGWFFACLGISTIADAKTYTCSCAYQDGGSTISVDYVAVGSGCCTGATNTGAAFYTKMTGSTTTEAGYIEPAFAQSMCCGY